MFIETVKTFKSVDGNRIFETLQSFSSTWRYDKYLFPKYDDV